MATTTLPPSSTSEHRTEEPQGTSFARATRLVAEQEIRNFLRMKSFWIGLGVIIAGLFAISILPGVIGGGPPSVAVVGQDAAQLLSGSDVDTREAADTAAAEQLVRDDEVDAAVVPDTAGESASGVRVLALDGQPDDVLAALQTAPPVDLLDSSALESGARQAVIMVFALVFLIFGMSGSAIAQSTVTEKQTRIVEILVSTVPVRALLAGKIAGHAVLTVGQVAVLALAAPIALRLGGNGELLTLVAPALGWFVPFLCVGFVLLAAMWAVAGALVSRQEDLGSSMGLVMLLVMGPYFAVTFFSGDATMMTVLSYVPFSAAIAMPVRMFTQDAQAWEALLSLGILAGTVVLIVLLASRLYAGSMLRTRGKVSLRTAWARED